MFVDFPHYEFSIVDEALKFCFLLPVFIQLFLFEHLLSIRLRWWTHNKQDRMIIT